MTNTRRQIRRAFEVLASEPKTTAAACFAWIALLVAGSWFVSVMAL